MGSPTDIFSQVTMKRASSPLSSRSKTVPYSLGGGHLYAMSADGLLSGLWRDCVLPEHAGHGKCVHASTSLPYVAWLRFGFGHTADAPDAALAGHYVIAYEPKIDGATEIRERHQSWVRTHHPDNPHWSASLPLGRIFQHHLHPPKPPSILTVGGSEPRWLRAGIALRHDRHNVSDVGYNQYAPPLCQGSSWLMFTSGEISRSRTS